MVSRKPHKLEILGSIPSTRNQKDQDLFLVFLPYAWYKNQENHKNFLHGQPNPINVGIS